MTLLNILFVVAVNFKVSICNLAYVCRLVDKEWCLESYFCYPRNG